MLSLKQYLQEQQDEVENAGTYAAMKFASVAAYGIIKYANKHRIPDPVPVDKLHVTLMYSRRTLLGYTAQGDLNPPMKVHVKGFDVWDSQNGAKVLVALLDAPELVARHEYLMKTYNGTYDFPEYKPHFTLSYDVGPGYGHYKLPDYPTPLFLKHEYSKPLDLNWKA